MSQLLIFDHAILVVDNLNQAQKDFQSLGFTVFYGGKHADGKTENCLIVFQDGSYIELIGLIEQTALDDPDGMHARLFGPGEGWVGYALLSHDLEQDIQSMRRRGLSVTDPQDNSRARPDGKTVAWRAATLENAMIPFFLEDRTLRSLRVPDDERRIHANGVSGVARVVVGVPQLEEAVEQYEKILGQSAVKSTLNLPDTSAFDFPQQTATLTLAAPINKRSVLRDQVTERGSSIYMLRLYSHRHEALLDLQRTHSARIELVNL